ncbi:MAG TPA: hypothetical protein VGD71_09255 [Kribbella sp.]|jgi:hypothetical protein
MVTLTEAPPTTGRLRAAWSAAHTSVAGVPRWARIAAYTVPITVLPSSVWRIAGIVFHLPLDGSAVSDRGSGDVPSWLPMEVYVVVLSIFSEVLAFTAVGLIARWGEVFPQWIPGLRGRRVPMLAAVIPAALGAAALTALWTASAVAVVAGRTVEGQPLPVGHLLTTYDWHFVVLAVSYAPLLLWGPLVGVATVAYWRRRRRATSTVQ